MLLYDKISDSDYLQVSLFPYRAHIWQGGVVRDPGQRGLGSSAFWGSSCRPAAPTVEVGKREEN